MSGIRPQRTYETSLFSNGYIAKLLRMAGSTATVSRVSYASDILPGLTWGILDTGTQPINWRTRGDEVIHILHAENEPDVRITVDGSDMPILPGDSLTIGSDIEIGSSKGVLALQVQSDLGDSRVVGVPAHGPEDYVGFNRRTLCAAGPPIRLERWKLTVPHTFELDHLSPAALTVLFGNISFIHEASVETLGPGESVVYRDGPVRAVPDGLAYVAVIRESKVRPADNWTLN